ncbi:DNA LIGASE 4 [Salix purpurea]|uniref:DNA LIGASE 4 n=1 Tax=Salix purpurea TaxID=77065 RepID=A0A9Q0P051_SALPP|nr:DNA LIGASE 4 [Salix purpurea]
MSYLHQKLSDGVVATSRFVISRSPNNCYGRATKFVTQCLEILQVLSKHLNLKKQLVTAGILPKLFENNIHQGPKAARVQARVVLCAFSEGDINTVTELNSLIQKKVMYCLEHHRSMDIALATREELILLSEHSRFMSGNKSAAEHTKNWGASNKTRDSQLLSYSEWEKGASYLDFVRRQYKVSQTVKGLDQRSRSQRNEYLFLKYGLRWKRRAGRTSKGGLFVFELGSWSSSRRFRLLNLLIALLPATFAAGESATEYFELLFKMVASENARLFLTVRGCLTSICKLIIQEVVSESVGSKQGAHTRRVTGEPYSSLIECNMDDVEKIFKEAIENRDEGIVLKDLGSKWEPSDRSGKWLKLKPEYVRAGSDLDALIMGGYYGSGRRGGEVAQFLVGLAERPAPNTYPRRFISFCRVGNGLSDEELDTIVSKLKLYLRKNGYPKKSPPSFYQVTNNSKERPDVWIESPDKSIILSITSGIRTISSVVFSAPYSLRFPRIDRVRYDKLWHECLDVQSFIELVHSSNGTTQNRKGFGDVQTGKPTHTDISDIKGETLIFSNVMFYFVNVPPTNLLESLHKMVAENGGTFSMNLNNSVTHCIDAESKGIKYQAAKLHGDIIHYSWVLDCCLQKKLLPLQPKYFVFLSDGSKKKLQEEIDEFYDSYYWDLDLSDINQLLKQHQYIRRCQSYRLLQEKVLRLKLEIFMGGGKVSNNIAHATHLVVLIVPASYVDFGSLVKSFTTAEKHFLLNKRLYVIGSQWLEDSLERGHKLLEDTYNLKPSGLEESNSKEVLCDLDMKEVTPILDGAGNEILPPDCVNKAREKGSKTAFKDSNKLVSLEKGMTRKRGRPAGGSTRKGEIGAGQAR